VALAPGLRHALPAFWQASSKQAARQALAARDGSQLLSGIAQQADEAAQAYAGKSGLGLGGELDAGEYLGRTMQQALLQAQARLEQASPCWLPSVPPRLSLACLVRYGGFITP
jgi:biopolymer transport protein ExbB